MIRKLMRTASVFIAILFALGACDKESLPPDTGVRFPGGTVFEKLTQYRLFNEPMSALKPAEGVLPYDLNAPLFSDYAQKQRFVYVPAGKTVAYDTADVLKFPIGTILVKSFIYTLPTGARKIIETRLLLNQSNGWNAEVYVWNDGQTEATRMITGKEETITFMKNGEVATTSYQVPNKNQCKACHQIGTQVMPIGPKVANINKTYNYETGGVNQIDKWVSEGFLSASSGNIPRWPDYTDPSENLGLRARAYLEVNCAHCHRREGAASNSGLYLRYSNYDSLSLGFYKSPVAAGNGSGDLSNDILPGKAAESIIYFRMNSTEVDVRMPELGRTLIHEEGVALIRDWINAMK
jgi:uncharacterized repeat protein (TIGR03806 family)